MSNWIPTIGLEMHARLPTKSKIFSHEENNQSNYCGYYQNTDICEIDLGMPGTLPTPNPVAIDYAIVFGLAVGGKISRSCEFVRKHYFYPDLSKGYQISQHENPIVTGGYIQYSEADKIKLIQAHLEEDAGKLTHDDEGFTKIDYNRAGCSLLEIVTEPHIQSASKAVFVAKSTKNLLHWLGICKGNMQDGEFRIDANISMRQSDSGVLGTRCEIKNLNSFYFLEMALEFEIKRQKEILMNGCAVTQQTRLFDEKSGETVCMRNKENADDYRYFPDPDLPVIEISNQQIEELEEKYFPETSPSSPFAAREHLKRKYGLSAQIIKMLIKRRGLCEYFEIAATIGNPIHCGNWIFNDLMMLSKQNETLIEESRVSPENLAKLVDLVVVGNISGPTAKAVLAAMWETGKDAETIIRNKGEARSYSDEELLVIVKQIMTDSPKQVYQVKAGSQKTIGWFVGQAMKETGGVVDPKKLKQLFEQEIQ